MGCAGFALAGLGNNGGGGRLPRAIALGWRVVAPSARGIDARARIKAMAARWMAVRQQQRRPGDGDGREKAGAVEQAR